MRHHRVQPRKNMRSKLVLQVQQSLFQYNKMWRVQSYIEDIRMKMFVEISLKLRYCSLVEWPRKEPKTKLFHHIRYDQILASSGSHQWQLGAKIACFVSMYWKITECLKNFLPLIFQNFRQNKLIKIYLKNRFASLGVGGSIKSLV